MKRLIVIAGVLLTLAIGRASFAQSGNSIDGYIELLRSDLKTKKVAVITDVMDFTEEQGKLFWPTYREYEHELAKIQDGRIAVIKDYAEHYEDLTDEKADELMTQVFKLDDERLKLQKKYYKKIAKEISPKIAARWQQVENQIQLLINLQIASEVPLVD